MRREQPDRRVGYLPNKRVLLFRIASSLRSTPKTLRFSHFTSHYAELTRAESFSSRLYLLHAAGLLGRQVPSGFFRTPKLPRFTTGETFSPTLELHLKPLNVLGVGRLSPSWRSREFRLAPFEIRRDLVSTWPYDKAFLHLQI